MAEFPNAEPTAASLATLRTEYTNSIDPARNLATGPYTSNASSATSSTKPTASPPTK